MIDMPQLLIDIPAPAGFLVGTAVTIYVIALAIRVAWPVLNDKAARRVERIRRYRRGGQTNR